MKQRDGYGEDQDTATTKRIPWNVDNATENGPSSLQVLLMWLLTPGNYERLHSKQRNKAISSILSALKKNGIHHRSESSIRSKVSVIENQYLAAKRWLDDRAMRGDNIVNGSADADSEAQVLALCPHFIELFPELRHSVYLNELAAKQDQDEATDSDHKPKPARPKQKRKLKKDDHRPTKRRRAPSTDDHIQEVDEVRPQKPQVLRRTSSFGEMIDDDIALNEVQDWLRPDHNELVVRDPNVQLIHSDLQRQVAEIKLEHVKKESKAVLENDDKMRAAMLECDIEVKRERGQVQLLLEKVLARQTMKKEGVPNEEIDSILPLKEL